MPAAAVIPAPIAYLNVVAVKKLVVEILDRAGLLWSAIVRVHPFGDWTGSLFCPQYNQAFYFEEIRVFQADFRLNTPAWNNRKGLLLFYWLLDVSND